MRVSSLSYQETCKLYQEVKARKRNFEEMQAKEEEEKLRQSALDTLPLVYEEMMRIAEQEDPAGYEEMLEASDEAETFDVTDYLSIPSLFGAAIEKFDGVYFVSKEEDTRDGVPCMQEDTCWYNGNRDRTGRHTLMLFCPLVPDVMICDECDTGDFWYELFERHGLVLEGLNSYVFEYKSKL